MNSYENTSKSPFSATSSGQRGSSILTNMKAMIQNQDQKLQQKLQALNDLKESMNQPTKIGLAANNESFNRTRVLSKDYHSHQRDQMENNNTSYKWGSTQDNLSIGNQSQLLSDMQFERQNEDPELRKLRDKYLENNETNTSHADQRFEQQLSTTQTVATSHNQHQRNQSFSYMPKKEEESHRSSINKSFEIGVHHRKQSYVLRDAHNEKREIMHRMFQRSRENSPKDQYQKVSDKQNNDKLIEREEINNGEDQFFKQYLTQQYQEPTQAPKPNKKFQPLNLDVLHNKQRNIANLNLNPSNKDMTKPLSDMINDITERTDCTQSGNTLPRQEFYQKRIESKAQSVKSLVPHLKLPQNESNSKSQNRQKNTNESQSFMHSDIMSIKNMQRDQSQCLSKIKDRLEKQETEIVVNINKSVERIATELQQLKNQLFQQKTEDDSRFMKLQKDVKDIKHYLKRKSKKQSKRHLGKENSGTNIVMNTGSDIHYGGHKSSSHGQYLSNDGLSNTDAPCYNNLNSPSNFEFDPNAERQAYEIGSAHFGQEKHLQNQRRSERDQRNQQQVQPLQEVHLKNVQNSKIPAQPSHSSSNHYSQNHHYLTQAPQQDRSPINDNRVYYDFQTLSNQNNQSCAPIYDEFPQKLPSNLNNSYQQRSREYNNNYNQNEQTLTLNFEIEKVREESQKNIKDLKSFYETQLQQMREEFQNREIILKDKMKSQIQDSMTQERQKLADQLQMLEKEKAQLHFKIQQQYNQEANQYREGQAVQSNTQSQSSLNKDINYKQLQIKANYQHQIKIHQNPIASNERVPKDEQFSSIENGEVVSSKKEQRRKTRESKRSKDYSNIPIAHPSNYVSSGGRRKNSERQRDGNNLNYSIPISRGSQKENTYNQIRSHISGSNNQPNDKLYMKEKEILNRINKIESFLNRA